VSTAALRTALLSALLVLTGCQKNEAPPAMQAPPAEVRVITARAETVPVVNIGRTHPRRAATSRGHPARHS